MVAMAVEFFKNMGLVDPLAHLVVAQNHLFFEIMDELIAGGT